MTLEEKSMAYADNANVTIENFCKADIEDAYLAGATEALASQWVSVEDEFPEVNTLVLTKSRNAVNLCDYDGEDFYNILPEYKVRPTHWMTIPPVKGGDGNDC